MHEREKRTSAKELFVCQAIRMRHAVGKWEVVSAGTSNRDDKNNREVHQQGYKMEVQLR